MEELNNCLERRDQIRKAVVCYFIQGERVLLGLRKKTPPGFGEQLYSGIGGKLEPGETKVEALVREIREEIEVTPVDFKEVGRVSFFIPGRTSWEQDVTVFVSGKWSGEPVETDVIKPVWFHRDSLPFDKMWADNRFWLPRVLKGDPVDAVFLLGDDLSVKDHDHLTS